MKKTFFILGMSLCFLFSNCVDDKEKEEETSTIYAELDVVTGLDFYDENGSPIGRWKSPNNNPGAVYTYPNPNTGVVAINSQEKIVRIWLIPADCVTDNTIDIPELSSNLTFEIPELESVQIKDIPLTDFNTQINLNLSDVAAGFYRIFFELETGTILWENIYADPSVSSIPTFDFLDGLCD
jgi:hypothetical protein